MCRFIAYTGKPILLSELLIKPENSLIKQSYQARESNETLNGDGFGLGWYTHEIETTPGVFKSIQPAWNNQNLMHLAPKIRSNCFFAHVRAATEGGVAQDNCHPYSYGELLFMHNGGIGSFKQIKRYLRRQLENDIYEGIKGQTDSEHFFALMLQLHRQQKRGETMDEYAETMIETIAEIQALEKQYGIGETSFLNLVLTNGQWVIATRYVSDTNKTPRSLYYSAGSELEHVDGFYHMQPTAKKNNAVLIVSEKLNDTVSDWTKVDTNKMILIDDDFAITVKDLD